MKKQIVTINVPNAYIEAFESLIQLGLFNSRSEVVREALKEFLESETALNDELETTNFYKILSVKTNLHPEFGGN